VARENAEHLVDANALRVFEQEIYELELAVQAAKRDLAAVVAERIQLQREISITETSIEQREKQGAKALEKGEESLALEIAELIAEKASYLEAQSERLAKLKARETTLHNSLQQTIDKVGDYCRELSLARANDSANKALYRLSKSKGTIRGRLGEIEQTLDRIKTDQQGQTDQLAALEQVEKSLSETALDARIKAANLRADPDKVEQTMARMRERAQTSADHPPP